MPRSANNFRNAIVCEDIREEIGNKQSLMGIFGGDILVGELPATIQMAIFLQYVPNEAEDIGPLTIEIELLQDESLMVRAKVQGTVSSQQPVTFVLPKAQATFEKECTFKIMASIDGGTKQEVISKKVIKSDSVEPRKF